MREVVIDCAGIRSEDTFWQHYLACTQPAAAAMFGCNLDAFWDAVQGGGPGWPGQVRLVFTNCAHLARLSICGGTATFLDALKGIAADVTTIPIVVRD